MAIRSYRQYMHFIEKDAILKREHRKLTLMVEGTVDMKRKDANAGVDFTTLAATRRDARENMLRDNSISFAINYDKQ